MNATLEKELAALSVEEKAEVIDRLLPDVVGRDEDGVPAHFLAELERRAEEFEKNPTTGMTLDQFDQKWFGRK